MEKLSSIEVYTNRQEKQRSKELIFQTLILDQIIGAFEHDLEDMDFDMELIREFEEEIEKLDEDKIKGVLATPKELRLKNFPIYLKKIEEGTTNPQQVVKEITNIAQKNGYTLGYHVTNNKILPSPNNEWNIIGTEIDDRDDRAMAYYSLTYADIYRTDRRKFLYVIRANTGPNTEHKTDTSNNWGRASTLPIVHEINLLEIDEQVEYIYSQREVKRDAA
jgi:hypothetical protein